MSTGALGAGDRWRAAIGEQTASVLSRASDLDDDERARVRDEAASILAKCAPPDEPGGRTTGLVLGQVQSGKTLSFTTVAAMAKDNGYPLVIVITGTTVPLLKQSAGRLRRDLGLDSGNRKWKHISVIPQAAINRNAILDTLDEWRDENVRPHERRTVLITVMKQHRNLQKLIEAIRSLRLDDVPTLVIDDEGDQASLNIKVRTSEQSPTYQKIKGLRDCLPRHTFLQYTATPQALLLISIIDVLSPTFAELLTPGQNYSGGSAFFTERTDLVRAIPPNEVPTRQNHLEGPPDSLFEAMRLFFLGVAAGMENDDGGNRSMLIHPSVTRAEHSQFHHWVSTTKEDWKRILNKPSTNPDRIDLINEFRPAYDDLRHTVSNLPPFDELATRLLSAVRGTQVEKVNAAAGATPSIDWNDSYSFILVGGTAMDRGYTVRGLTVTYMPRGLGEGNADTVQQRGRFFGYKRSYLGYCRVFLESAVIAAFRSYVEHEEDVRARLAQHRATGSPLSEWPRAFLLDLAMKPTRSLVIDIPYLRRRFGDDWFWPRAPHDSTEAVASNHAIIADSHNWLDFVPDKGHADRTDFQKHLVADSVPLRQVYENLLAPFRFARFQDSQNYVSLLIVLKGLLEDQPDASAKVYLMSCGRARERTLDDQDALPVLFQGAAPVQPVSLRGSVYPGDSVIHDAANVSIQIHNLRLTTSEGRVLENIPALAIWLPSDLGRDMLIQPQGVVPRQSKRPGISGKK